MVRVDGLEPPKTTFRITLTFRPPRHGLPQTRRVYQFHHTRLCSYLTLVRKKGLEPLKTTFRITLTFSFTTLKNSVFTNFTTSVVKSIPPHPSSNLGGSTLWGGCVFIKFRSGNVLITIIDLVHEDGIEPSRTTFQITLTFSFTTLKNSVFTNFTTHVYYLILLSLLLYKPNHFLLV